MRKRILSIMLAICMVLALVPQAAFAGGYTDNTPSLTAFATKEQLMNAFTPASDGTAVNIGKLAFGKNSSGQTQEWYILGKDTGVTGDNTILFAASPIDAKGKFHDENSTNNTFESDEVYLNHYGASDLRSVLQTMAASTGYFTAAEQGIMNATMVTTYDVRNSKNYTTTDKLYLLNGSVNGEILYAGSGDGTALSVESYWDDGNMFWLRTPDRNNNNHGLLARAGNEDRVGIGPVDTAADIQPAANLNLTNVLFASGAGAASSGSVSSGTISAGAAMTLRMDGKDYTALTNAEVKNTHEKITYIASTEITLVVQGRGFAGGEVKDWYYSVTGVDGAVEVSASDIESALSLDYIPNLNDCKIWVETTGTDGFLYAVMDPQPSVTAFASKDQLMTAFTPNSNGTAANIGKIAFGKNSSGQAQKWYILGKDIGVEGDNTILFAASPTKSNQVFNSSDKNKTDKTLWSDCNYNGSNPTEVYPNHYGASDLRGALKGMAEDTNYFTAAEQDLMNATTVTTYDVKNSNNYTTTDKLYLLQGEVIGEILYAGSGDGTALSVESYWDDGNMFWLRTPDRNNYNHGLLARAADYDTVGFGHISMPAAIQPAANLNLTNVLFASGAGAASYGSVSTGTISAGSAMTLRLDGTYTAVGTVIYDVITGNIAAQKDVSAAGAVSLVIQGNDGVNDWYYSTPVEGTTVVTAEQIKDAVTSLDKIPDLSDCRIWIETTIDNVAYAKMAEAKDIEIIDSVAITGMDVPVGGEEFDTEASCNTTGIATATPAITYTTAGESGDVEATGIAEWNRTYKAEVTLAAGTVDDVVYVFDNSVSVTVDGAALSDTIHPNADGTLTITREFTTEKRYSITSIELPLPAGNLFTNYYGYDGYEALPTDGDELGKKANVKFTDKADQTTHYTDMNVTWTIANDGGAGYDKTPGATNKFKWTIPANALADYDVTGCPGYDSASGTITGTVSIKNKAAVPVTITGTDSEIEYTGTDIDVSQYFNIDSNAGTATYSLLTGAEGVTGAGTLNGSNLSVTRTGIFKVKVTTAANGIYAAGEGSITLTVANGTIQYEAAGYSGTYDGQEHSISVSVTNPADTTITYSTDGENYGNDNPSFTDAGTYTVYYKIEKNNYDKVEGSKTVTIDKRDVSITAQAQSILWGNSINQSSYDVSENGIAAVDKIAEITLTPSTTELTDDGTISISGVKIENTADRDVTGNYDINLANGSLTITHNTSLAPESIDAVKTKTSYKAGNTLNVDDITVTAYYADGYSEEVTDYTTNAADIDMSKTGNKTLTVSYTKNGETKTADITITVNSVYIPLVQKPTIETGEGVKVTLSTDGTVATITVDDGYEIADVALNGISLGKVTEVKDLKTGDKLMVTASKKPAEPTEPTKEEILAVLADQKLVARSKLVTMKNGKKAVLITWYNRNGEMMDFDGVEIFRSTKRNSGYGKKPIFTSATGRYYNTAVKKGTKYYYKVRGFVIIDGQKYYTDYSLKAIRTAK